MIKLLFLMSGLMIASAFSGFVFGSLLVLSWLYFYYDTGITFLSNIYYDLVLLAASGYFTYRFTVKLIRIRNMINDVINGRERFDA